MFHVNNNTAGIEEPNYEVKVSELRQLMKSKNVGNQIAFDDLFLLKFLKARNFKVNEAFQLLSTYLSLFEKHAEYFDIEIAQAAEDGLFIALPQRTSKGESITLCNVGQWDPRKVTFSQFAALLVFGYELLAMDPQTQENGNIQIFDMGGLSWKQMSKLGVAEVRTLMNIIIFTFPIDHKKVIIVRDNAFTNILFKIAQPFLGTEVRQRLLFIGTDLGKLHDYVSPDILPAKFGGNAPELDYNKYSKILKDNGQRLLNLWKTFKPEN